MFLRLESQGETIKKERIIQNFHKHFMNVFESKNTLRWPDGLPDDLNR